MVNQKRVYNKLPELLIDGPITIRENYNDYFNYRYKILQLKKKKPGAVAKVVQDLANLLDDFERIMSVEL